MGKRHICCELGEHETVAELFHETVPDDEKIEDLANLFKMFADLTRVKILFHLSVAEMCVCHLTEALGMNQPAVSNQLKVLKEANLIKSRKEGKNVYYSLADDHVRTILRQGMDHVNE
ncbi:MAG: helix-turn-helix transcriptional regulator [Eubacterium sp.]|nr:helix-turn-helix transcriptional regulator [Eubacterium sp.]